MTADDLLDRSRRLVAPSGSGGDAAVEIAIVGAGFSGLGMAIRLEQAGRRDYVILEQAGDVGGTWRDNTYPGAACDVQSNLYSFSFAPNPAWTSSFSAQPEILRYLRHCAVRFGVRDKIRFHHEVTAARWSAETQRWHISTTGGEVSARYLVASTGPLTEPAIPDLPGLATFQGPVWHSARWRHDVDLTGKDVAVIGTGASAAQIIPELQRQVGHLDVYQRTPPWVIPRNDRRLSLWEQRLFRLLPPAQLGSRAWTYWTREVFFLTFKSWARRRNPTERIALAHLAAQVPDAGLRASLTPAYSVGCKRILLSDDYYPALSQLNVSVITDGIGRVTRSGVVDCAGVERPADAIVLGTGFRATDPALADLVWGRDGIRLKDTWSTGMAAYKGTTIAGYPNLFVLVGPNTGLGHNSIVYIIESQVAYVLGALDAATRRGATEVSVRPEAQATYNDKIQKALTHTVWSTGGCNSWYLDRNGRNTTLWPTFSFRYRAALRCFDADAYELLAPPPHRAIWPSESVVALDAEAGA
jgi:cation diffusion facilitator CzcD-associated flavoprotein CzcO